MSYFRGGPLVSSCRLFPIAAHTFFYGIYWIPYLVDFMMYRFTVKNRWRIHEYVLKERKKSIIVCNHTTVFDPVMMCWAVWPFSVHHTLLEATMRNPWLATLIQLLGGMPMPSGRRGKEKFLNGIQSALKRRPAVLIYPEGECFVQNQTVNKFHTGAFVASMELKIPVFPFATVFYEPKTILGWKSPRPRAEVHILEPIYPDGFSDPKEFAEYTRQVIQAEIDRCNGTNAYCKGQMARIKGIN